MSVRVILITFMPSIAMPVSEMRGVIFLSNVPGASTNGLPDDVGTIKSCTSLYEASFLCSVTCMLLFIMLRMIGCIILAIFGLSMPPDSLEPMHLPIASIITFIGMSIGMVDCVGVRSLGLCLRKKLGPRGEHQRTFERVYL